MTKFTFCEFFAGGGMARAGLGDSWRCMFANDFDEKKVSTYKANWGAADIAHCDVASLLTLDLPTKAVDLVWASFPCQDLRSPGGARSGSRAGRLVDSVRNVLAVLETGARSCEAWRRSANDRLRKRAWMPHVPRGPGLRRDCVGAVRIGLQLRSDGYRRISFRSTIAASRVFCCGSEKPHDSKIPCWLGATRSLASQCACSCL